MMLVFWVLVFALSIGCVSGLAGFVLIMLLGGNKPLKALPMWQVVLRTALFPRLDATPEELVEIEHYEAIRAQQAQHQHLLSEINRLKWTR